MMSKLNGISSAACAVKTSFSVAVLGYQIRRLKTRQDEQEGRILPAYKDMVSKDPNRDRGHLEEYSMFKQRCEKADKTVRDSKGLDEWHAALEKEKAVIEMALERLEEARKHAAISAVKDIMSVAEDAKNLLEDVNRTAGQKP